MGRGEAPWPGATARRFRLARALAALALTLPAGALATACGDSPADRRPSRAAGEAAPTPPASASASASPRRPLSPAELCTTAVRHWAREALDGATPYGDYQSMGLSDRQYGVLREVLADARAVRSEQGTRAARSLIDRQARARCAEAYREGAPTRGPWR
ncbi:hypothetical protein ACIGKG_30010 [Streptomyces rochei]|uniref:hypothetical protein n=1 Tax=Streptomyces TaxID=1883 RepID=UPI0021AF531E|nr:hypothetical protein [Streptomyces sp. WAC08452]